MPPPAAVAASMAAWMGAVLSEVGSGRPEPSRASPKSATAKWGARFARAERVAGVGVVIERGAERCRVGLPVLGIEGAPPGERLGWRGVGGDLRIGAGGGVCGALCVSFDGGVCGASGRGVLRGVCGASGRGVLRGVCGALCIGLVGGICGPLACTGRAEAHEQEQFRATQSKEALRGFGECRVHGILLSKV
jgi:hypothetical protein